MLNSQISKEAKEGMEDDKVSTNQADIDEKEKSDNGDKRNTSEGRGNESKDAENVEKPDQGEAAGDTQKVGTVKSGKKKIVKKIVKKAKTVGDVASKNNVKLDEKASGEKNSDIPSDQPSSDSPAVKTFGRKKVTKRVGKSPQNEKNKDILPKVENEMDCSEDKSKDNSDLHATVGQDTTVVKTTVKKKVIKRVPKKKVTAVVSSEEVSKKDEDGDGNEKKVTTDETQDVEKSTIDDKQETMIPQSKSTSPTSLKPRDSVSLNKAEKENVKNDNETGKEISPVTNSIDKQKVGEKDSGNRKREKSRDSEQSKDEKEKMGKDESRSKPNKELKEKRKPEEPHRHPGLILQTKCSKDSKVG